MNGYVSLLVTIPVCSFRKGYAREYLETEEVPPPSTVYGFLLSLVGEEEREKYEGTRIAYCILKRPELSTVLRTVWRIKASKYAVGTGSNRRPDFQEILTQLTIGIYVDRGGLAEKLSMTGFHPDKTLRFGGLSLGESRDLINDISWYPDWPQREAEWLLSDSDGDLALPVWVDHVGSKHTVWERFRIERASLKAPLVDGNEWITIRRQG